MKALLVPLFARVPSFEHKNFRQRDYHKYAWKKLEFVKALACVAGIQGVLSYFFYRSVLAFFCLIPIGILLLLYLDHRKMLARQVQLADEFRECILAVVVFLQAGYSVENAFLECMGDMEMLYGKTSLIVEELSIIRRGIMVNRPIEELLLDLASRSGRDEIQEFSEVFVIAKKNGGNMAAVMKNSADLIERQMDTTNQIRILLAGKRMEMRMMQIMPFVILLYIDMGNRGYFDSLYHNLKGVLIMTGCLLVYGLAVYLGEWILNRLE